MKSVRIYLSVIPLVLLFSCSKGWFEKKSEKSIAVLASVREFEMLLENNSSYAPGLGEIASDGYYALESAYSDLTSISDPTAYSQRNAYTWTFEFPYTKVVSWNYTYSRIFDCNLALDGLRKIDPSGTNELEHYNQVKGNALFLRAKNFYDLCQLYAIPYNSGNSNSGMGIPLKEGIDITEPSSQASVKDCYEKIVSDLTEAAALLPPRSPYLNRGSRSAAFALLARTYLSMQNYTKAAEFADLSLGIYKKLIDYNSVPVNNSNMGGYNEEVLFYSVMYPVELLINNFFYIDSQLYKNYAINDLRRSRYFIENPDGSISFKGNYTESPFFQFAGLATDEVYLIRAECYARSGDITNALKYLNDLLITRWDNNFPYEPINASTSEEALEKILLERQKELLKRGIRWSDLRRLNLDPKTQYTLERIVEGKLYKLEPNSYKYTFPIPQDVLDLAPAMRQSPGWE